MLGIIALSKGSDSCQRAPPKKGDSGELFGWEIVNRSF